MAYQQKFLEVGYPNLFTAGHYRWLALIYATVTLFASLVPLTYQYVPFHTALHHYAAAFAEPLNFASLSDWLTNVVLFIPLGYLLTAASAVDRPRVRHLLGLVVVAGCGLFSASIEFTQIYFPPRVCSLNDVVAETIGAFLGVLLWLIVGQKLTGWARRDNLGFAGGVFPVEILPCCILMLMLVQWLPLDLSIEPRGLSRKFRDGRIRLGFFLPWPGAANFALREIPNIFLFAPLGILLAGLDARRWGNWANWRRVLGLGLLLVGMIKFIQLFVLSRNSFLFDVLTGVISILLGWALGVAVRKSTTVGWTPPEWEESKPQRWHLAAFLFVWILVALFLNWYPFDFSPNLAEASKRLEHISLMPFLDYWTGDYFQALDQFMSRLGLFMPVGLVLPTVLKWRTTKMAGIGVILIVACFATVIEIGQAFLPSRFPSFTDVLVETLGAWFGYLCAVRLNSSRGL